MKFLQEVISNKTDRVAEDSILNWTQRLQCMSSSKLQDTQCRSFFEQLSPELLYKIVLFLSAQDVSSCIQVCKRWKKLLESNYFWHCYTKRSIDWRPVIKVDGILLELTGNWNYGWGNKHMSCPSNKELFNCVPPMCKSGIILPLEINLNKHCHDFRSLYQAAHAVMQISKEVEENSIIFAGRGRGKGDCPINTCLFPWDHSDLPSTEKILEMFQINEQIVYNMLSAVSNEPLGQQNDLQALFTSRVPSWNGQKFCSMLSRIFGSYIELTVDYLGRTERYHPKVVFIITQLSPGWAGGILTGVW